MIHSNPNQSTEILELEISAINADWGPSEDVPVPISSAHGHHSDPATASPGCLSFLCDSRLNEIGPCTCLPWILAPLLVLFSVLTRPWLWISFSPASNPKPLHFSAHQPDFQLSELSLCLRTFSSSQSLLCSSLQHVTSAKGLVTPGALLQLLIFQHRPWVGPLCSACSVLFSRVPQWYSAPIVIYW